MRAATVQKLELEKPSRSRCYRYDLRAIEDIAETSEDIVGTLRLLEPLVADVFLQVWRRYLCY